MQFVLSSVFFAIWFVAIHSTYQTPIWNISVWFGEFIVVICWALIIVFWMN